MRQPPQRIFCLLVLLLLLLVPQNTLAFENVKFIQELKAGFQEPVDVAVSIPGDIYVLDRKAPKVYIFDSTGAMKSSFGEKGSASGQFNRPNSIAISPLGEIIVADSGNSRVQVFSGTGSFIFEFGSSGNLNGQFKRLTAVAVDQFGVIYAADQNNQRISSFSPKGVYLGAFDVVDRPMDIGLDSQRNIYVLMPQQGFIKVYQNGVSKGQAIKGKINKRNYLEKASGLVVDMRGDIYFTESYEHSIKKIDENQNLLVSFGSEGDSRGQFDSPIGITSDRDGRIYIADSRNQRVQILQVTGSNKGLMKVDEKSPPMVETYFAIEAEHAISDLAISPMYGLHVISDRQNHILGKGSKGGIYGQSGKKAGDFKSPQAMNIGSDGRIYVADTGNNRVQVLSPEGVPQYQFGKRGSKTGQFTNPQGIVVNAKGIIYVADTGNNRIQIFNSDGIFLSSFGQRSEGKKGEPLEQGSFNMPTALTKDSEGNIYVVDTGNNRVQVFNENGQYITEFGEQGSNNGEFEHPVDIAIDKKGYIFVADRGNNRIQIFDKKKQFIMAMGSPAKGPAYFPQLTSVTARKGKIFVGDYRLGHVGVFKFYPKGIVKEDRAYVTKTAYLPHEDTGI